MKDLRKKLERVQNYYGMRIILAQPPRTTSEELRGKPNWRTQERWREMSRMALVQRCVMKNALQCLNERLKTNAEIDRRVTQGHDHPNL